MNAHSPAAYNRMASSPPACEKPALICITSNVSELHTTIASDSDSDSDFDSNSDAASDAEYTSAASDAESSDEDASDWEIEECTSDWDPFEECLSDSHVSEDEPCSSPSPRRRSGPFCGSAEDQTELDEEDDGAHDEQPSSRGCDTMQQGGTLGCTANTASSPMHSLRHTPSRRSSPARSELTSCSEQRAPAVPFWFGHEGECAEQLEAIFRFYDGFLQLEERRTQERLEPPVFVGRVDRTLVFNGPLLSTLDVVHVHRRPIDCAPYMTASAPLVTKHDLLTTWHLEDGTPLRSLAVHDPMLLCYWSQRTRVDVSPAVVTAAASSSSSASLSPLAAACDRSLLARPRCDGNYDYSVVSRARLPEQLESVPSTTVRFADCTPPVLSHTPTVPFTPIFNLFTV